MICLSSPKRRDVSEMRDGEMGRWGEMGGEMGVHMEWGQVLKQHIT